MNSHYVSDIYKCHNSMVLIRHNILKKLDENFQQFKKLDNQTDILLTEKEIIEKQKIQHNIKALSLLRVQLSIELDKLNKEITTIKKNNNIVDLSGYFDMGRRA